MLVKSRPKNACLHMPLLLSPCSLRTCSNSLTRIRYIASQPAAPNTIIHIPRADVFRFGDGNKARPVFKDVEWTVKEGENWAVVGPAGSEKSDLLEVRFFNLRSNEHEFTVAEDAIRLHANNSSAP